jgi:hypothetical protein
MEEASEYLIGASSWDFAKHLLLLEKLELCFKKFFFCKKFWVEILGEKWMIIVVYGWLGITLLLMS